MTDNQLILIALVACVSAGLVDSFMITLTHGRHPIWVFFSGVMLVLSIVLAAKLFAGLA